MNINNLQKKVSDILCAPPKKYSKDEALELLRECGILDKNNRIKPEYRDIIVTSDDEEGSIHIDAEFTSVWDGGTRITTPCKVNLTTGEVFDIVLAATGPCNEGLADQYITIGSAEHAVVCKDDYDLDSEHSGFFWYR